MQLPPSAVDLSLSIVIKLIFFAVTNTITTMHMSYFVVFSRI